MLTGVAYACAFGRQGDIIRKWNWGEIDESVLPVDGVLRRERNLSAMLWLFPEQPAVLLENQRPDAVVLDSRARQLIIDAFAIPRDSVSMFR